MSTLHFQDNVHLSNPSLPSKSVAWVMKIVKGSLGADFEFLSALDTYCPVVQLRYSISEETLLATDLHSDTGD